MTEQIDNLRGGTQRVLVVNDLDNMRGGTQRVYVVNPDTHTKGYFTTQAALEEAYPTAEAGDWAIVGATDTVWIWDEDSSAWVDSDQKGQVTSVNNQTGDVTITTNDVLPSQTGYSGRVLGTDGFVAGWIKPEIVQRSTMPQASEDELGNVYQFVGTTDANYTNGYFYKCVSDGGNPATYSWSQTNVQPAPSGLPSQTGNAGKFLTTDGTDASWDTTITEPLTIDYTGGTQDPLKLRNQNGKFIVKINYKYNGGLVILGVTGSGSSVWGYSAALTLDYGGSSPNRIFSVHPMGNSVDKSYLGESSYKWDNVYTKNLNNGADITVPTTGGTLALTSDLPSTPATMPTLAVADWSSNTQTVNVTGVTASNIVFVAPAPASAADYAAAGIVCTAQGAGTLTFTCTTVPTNAITVNVVIMG